MIRESVWRLSIPLSKAMKNNGCPQFTGMSESDLSKKTISVNGSDSADTSLQGLSENIV
jgi:hypothetical protein